IDWLIRCLDCDANDSLSELIDTRIGYLKSVMDHSSQIFPKGLIQDKFISYGVCLTIHNMLEAAREKVKRIHNKKFILNKFQHISNTGNLLISHLARGFSYFSSELSGLKTLDEASISETVKKSRSRFGSMFLLFIQHAFAAHAEEFHNEIE